MPRAAQERNVLACIYHLPPDDPLPFSHAYLPRAAFDEWVEREGWILARKGAGYLALYSQHPTRWLDDAEGRAVELRAETPDNVWLCELGEAADWGSFAAFCDAIAAAEVRCQGLEVRYDSPSLGAVRFGWEGPFEVAGRAIALHDSPRFDNPYCRCAFLSPRVTIRRGEETLELELTRAP
jgi:hypothetical protein